MASDNNARGERLGKDAAYILDSDKARQKLGWQDTVDLGAGIEETIAWVLSYRAKQIGTLTYSLQRQIAVGLGLSAIHAGALA